MIFELSAVVIVYLPILFVGILKSRKSAEEMWKYMKPIPYTTIPSRHENCIKSIAER